MPEFCVVVDDGLLLAYRFCCLRCGCVVFAWLELPIVLGFVSGTCGVGL